MPHLHGLRASGSAARSGEKVHTLLTIHRPNFEAVVRLEGATLTDALIGFMPECNAQEGRTIRRELTAAGKHTDYEEAVRRCVEIVRESADAARDAPSLAFLNSCFCHLT